ncbi:hypothetical protein C2845_PM12G16170 [Panicum miliaceum]|uniref:Uncharacterized protein n=1 Tax=Panicum miliaceum TaxID=4540 RepID=A0A3L6QER0_PANMI|nr:hypothetical protein C2845_PM12G16170 [Panicum miliaceum]
MSTTQEEIPTLVDDDEPKEENAKKNEDEKKEEESSGEDSDYDTKSVKVTKKGSSKTFAKIPFNYGRLNGSSQIASVNLGKPPRFDGTGYSSWRNSMRVYLIGVKPDIWKIVCRCEHSRGR